MGEEDINDVNYYGASRTGPKTIEVNLKIRFECPYCMWITLENTILTPKDPYKRREALFKCGNCGVSWEIREVR